MKKRLLTFLLALSIMISITPMSFAEDATKTDVPSYASLGDSMSNGLGLEGYDMADGTAVNGFLQQAEDAYPALLADHYGWELTQLATSAFRAEDAYALLTYESANSGAVRFDSSTWTITGPVGTSAIKFDGYFAEAVVGRCEDYNGGVGFRSGSSTFNGTTYYDGVAWVADQYQYAVSNANVVSLALGGNNFGTFLSMTLLNQLNEQFGLDMGGLDYGITEQALAERIAELAPEQAAMALLLRNELEKTLSIEGVPQIDFNMPTNVDEFIDTMALYGTYSFVGFVLGYQGVLDYIAQNNPDADVIILALNNTLYDFKIDITGKGIAVIDCGKYFECIYNAANSCSASLASDYDELNIYYAKAADQDLEIIYNALRPDSAGQVDWTNYGVAKSRLLSSMKSEIRAVKAQAGAYASRITDEDALETLLAMAHSVDALSVPATLAYMTNDSSNEELYAEGMNNALYLAFRFTAASGIGCHPSVAGHEAMKEAIIDSYKGNTGSACNGNGGCPTDAFADLEVSQWYHEALDFILGHGLMNGVGNGKFDPDGSINRAMIVTILWRLEGSPSVNNQMQFKDVAEGTWYTEAIRWAAAEGIVTGYSDFAFGPNDSISHEQLVTIMWRYARYKGCNVSGASVNMQAYVNVSLVSEWAMPAMQWACSQDLMYSASSENAMELIIPTESATRLQAAVFIYNFCVRYMA